MGVAGAAICHNFPLELRKYIILLSPQLSVSDFLTIQEIIRNLMVIAFNCNKNDNPHKNLTLIFAFDANQHFFSHYVLILSLNRKMKLTSLMTSFPFSS